MSKKNISVGPSGSGSWNVDRGGRTVSTHRTQGTAIDKAKPMAVREGADLIIKGRDGRIRSKDSYGKDPNPPKDREH